MSRISKVLGAIMGPGVVSEGSGTSGETAEEKGGTMDVATHLDRVAAAFPGEVDWRLSVVDLLKLVEIDHTYESRKAMAIELGYPAEEITARGSAELNLWLHGKLMDQLAEKGGQIPEGLPARVAA